MEELNFFIDTNIPALNQQEIYFKKIKPELTNRENQVLEAIQIIQPCTMHQVANFMGRELNTISGRFSKLVEKGYIKIIGRTQDKKSIYITI